jgi:hypothetical protein
MSTKMPKRPRDPNQLAKLMVDIATGETSDSVTSSTQMAELGRSGGLKGGAARAASMSPERRQEIAKQAAQSRWTRAKK